uniref:Uncharacterized protein n=1 Tax=Plectus sambesii TaxID=2011161 RepID=A0A914VAA1_9BILA
MTFAERTKKSLELRSTDRLDYLTNESVLLDTSETGCSWCRAAIRSRGQIVIDRRLCAGKSASSLRLLPAISARSSALVHHLSALLRTGRGDYPIAFAVGKHRCAAHLPMTDGGARLGQSGATRGGVGSTLVAAAN